MREAKVAQWKIYNAAIARAAKFGDHEAADAARREMRTAKLADHIREVVDAAPPLTAEQRALLGKAVAGDVDWRRVAIELFKTEGACRGLSAQETNALLDAVDAEREARAAADESAWGTRHERTVDAADRGPE